MTLPNLQDIKGIGPAYYKRVAQGMERDQLSLEQVYRLTAEEIKQRFGLPLNAARAIANVNTTESQHASPKPKTEEEKASVRLGVTQPITQNHYIVLHRDDERYPAKLHRILGDKTPETLYVWGNLDLLDRPGVGFCGSRDVTEKGIGITRDITQQIAVHGWVAVSGHARGVDITAHRTALENGASTIIVLPQGLDGFKLRTELRKYARPDNLLIISEFAPNAGWHVGHAMQRNATIIGLSDAMVVIESRINGGTFNAGQTALKLRHPLFVVKFEDKTKSNAGNEYFLQRGAFEIKKSKATNRASIDSLVKKVQTRHEQNIVEAPDAPKQLTMPLKEA